MAKVAFSTTPPMDWNNGVNNNSILEELERLVLRAKASDNSISHGEWYKYWKALAEVMGNSEPTEVCDPSKQGAAYLESLIASLGGNTSSIKRDVFKLNGTNQYISIAPETENRSFLLAMTFYASTGQTQELMSHPSNPSYIRVTASGDMLIQIDGNSLITIPSAQVGDISSPKRLEVGRADQAARVRIDGNVVFSDENHGRGQFGAQYLGANQSLTSFSDAAIYDIQYITRGGEHFYLANDLTATLLDSGIADFDGTINNYNQSGWIEI